MKRILFVDDEQNVLDGLKRMLRGQRREWEMTFVTNGQAALDEMAAAPFDALVTDMRMPGMDGATLLSHAKNSYPSTVRIVLSGHAELEAVLRAVPVAHQFLSKPCESDVIRSVVTRACELQALLDDSSLQELVGGVDSLPALPRVYNELTAVLTDPEVCLDDVAAIVEQDVGITAKILQLVNSSFFGIPRTIGGIRDATSYLGTNMLSNLVLSMEVFHAFEGGRPGSFSIEKEQAHATLSGCIARRLVPDRVTADQAFLAGMLHDIGKLILATRLSEDYEKLLATHARSRKALWEIEEEMHGVSHAEIGGYLLGIWGMPYPIVEAVANHHRPARVEHDTFGLLGAVHVADGLTRHVTESANTSSSRFDLNYLESVGVIDELPGWREMAAAEAGMGTEDAA